MAGLGFGIGPTEENHGTGPTGATCSRVEPTRTGDAGAEGVEKAGRSLPKRFAPRLPGGWPCCLLRVLQVGERQHVGEPREKPTEELLLTCEVSRVESKVDYPGEPTPENIKQGFQAAEVSMTFGCDLFKVEEHGEKNKSVSISLQYFIQCSVFFPSHCSFFFF